MGTCLLKNSSNKKKFINPYETIGFATRNDALVQDIMKISANGKRKRYQLNNKKLSIKEVEQYLQTGVSPPWMEH